MEYKIIISIQRILNDLAQIIGIIIDQLAEKDEQIGKLQESPGEDREEIRSSTSAANENINRRYSNFDTWLKPK